MKKSRETLLEEFVEWGIKAGMEAAAKKAKEEAEEAARPIEEKYEEAMLKLAFLERKIEIVLGLIQKVTKEEYLLFWKLKEEDPLTVIGEYREVMREVLCAELDALHTIHLKEFWK